MTCTTARQQYLQGVTTIEKPLQSLLPVYKSPVGLQSIHGFDTAAAIATTKLDLFEYRLEDALDRVYARARAFFVPPVTGTYTFLCAADDYFALNGTLANGTELGLCSLPSWSGFREWDRHPSQVCMLVSHALRNGESC